MRCIMSVGRSSIGGVAIVTLACTWSIGVDVEGREDEGERALDVRAVVQAM